jgi:hypothetical protein
MPIILSSHFCQLPLGRIHLQANEVQTPLGPFRPIFQKESIFFVLLARKFTSINQCPILKNKGHSQTEFEYLLERPICAHPKGMAKVK